MNDNDNYSHTDMDLMYVTESIPGPAEDTPEYQTLIRDYNSQLLSNCTMCSEKQICVKLTCTCLQMSQGDNYSCYMCDRDILKYRLNYETSVYKHYPIIECNSNCACPATCGNRIVQNGPIEGLIVQPCGDKHKGLGLFTPQFIHSGVFICEYAGELLTKTQALQRTEQNEAQGKMNYIFCLNEHTSEGAIQTFVDPSKFGNIGRYINHSCEPNCQIVPVRCEIAIPRLAIFAFRDISAEEEITISYGSPDRWKDGPNIKSDGKGKNCHCNTNSCKGLMPFESF